MNMGQPRDELDAGAAAKAAGDLETSADVFHAPMHCCFICFHLVRPF